MAKVPKFMKIQQAFSNAVLGSAACPLEVDQNHVKIYRNLIHEGMDEILRTNFPVLYSLFNEEDWQQLISHFLQTHPCKTPLFYEIAEEFLDYLNNERDSKQDPSFLVELAHYEWVELALDLHENEGPFGSVDLFNDTLRVSSLAWLLQYDYPVHRIGKNYQPQTKPQEPTWLVVYRDRALNIGFLELNALSARLLALLKEQSITGEEALAIIATELQHPEPQTLQTFGLELLSDFLEKDIILAAYKSFPS